MRSQTSDMVIKNLWAKIPAQTKVTFFTGVISGLLTHAFMMANKLPNHDDLWQLVGNQNSPALGRWFVWFPALFSGIFSIPWLSGVLSIFYISIAACLVAAIAGMRKGLYCGLLAALMVTMPTVAGLMMYVHLSDAYFFALLLAVFAAYTALKWRYGFICAIIPLILSMGIYQTFLGVMAALLLIGLAIGMLRDDMPWQKTLVKAVKLAATLAVGVGGYVLSVRLTTPPDGLDSYQHFDQIGQIAKSRIPEYILNAYQRTAAFFFLNEHNFHLPFMAAAFALSAIACTVLQVLLCLRKRLHKKPPQLVLFVVLVALLPLAGAIIHMMGAYVVHDLMIYGMLALPILWLATADLYAAAPPPKREKEKPFRGRAAAISTWIIAATAVLTVYGFWLTSNQAYFKLFYGYEQTYAQSVLLVTRIQRLEGYTSGTPIVLIGPLRWEESIAELADISLAGAQGIELFGCWSYPNFLVQYLAFNQEVAYHDIDLVEDEGTRAIIAAMPLYPNDGSLRFIGDEIYVRFK